jgi:hypothetical protein
MKIIDGSVKNAMQVLIVLVNLIIMFDLIIIINTILNQMGKSMH